MIVLALFFATIGILFGLGRLMSYQLQVKRRIERQYEVEKVLATRSGLRMIDSSLLGITLKNVPCFTNTFWSGLNGAFEVSADPVRAILEDGLEVTEEGAWGKIQNRSPKTPVSERTMVTFETKRVTFECVNTNSPVERRCAIFRRMPLSWLDTQYGLVYYLEPDALAQNGFGRLRLTLVGMGVESLTEGNLDYNLATKPSFMLETAFSGGTVTNSGGVVAEVASRQFRMLNPQPGIVSSRTECLNKKNDEVSQYAGFILSGSHGIAFGSDANNNMLLADNPLDFSQVDLSPFAASNTWIVIEHFFPANYVNTNGLPPTLYVYMDTFQVREPMTYRLSTYNKRYTEKIRAANSCYQPEVTTWAMVTQYGNQGEGRSQRFCILDTVGTETKTNTLWVERR